jgi:hypothetical protein
MDFNVLEVVIGVGILKRRVVEVDGLAAVD